MKKFFVVLTVVGSVMLGGCQSFQKDHDLELYFVGAALTYAGGKWLCRHSIHDEKCGAALAATFLLWY